MKAWNINGEDLAVLNSKKGLKHLFANKEFNYKKAIQQSKYKQVWRDLHFQLVQLQQWVIKNEKKIVILFEGRDAAGKGGAIRQITTSINPRHYRIIALPKPTREEKGQWYFQRYIQQLPKQGEIVFFDRSWYNRAMVEPVNGFCTQKEYETFMRQVNSFEEMIIESDTYLIKFYLSISKSEQAKRFEEIKNDPLKRWKMTPVDRKAQQLWDEYTKYKEQMFGLTNTKKSPWIIIDANDAAAAQVTAAKYILQKIAIK